MIKVDNSYKKRLFINKFIDEILDLEKEVENKIKEIEENDYNYEELSSFESNTNAEHISVFKYKKEVCREINNLLRNPRIDENLKIELRDVKTNIYLILIGNFSKLKTFLDTKIDTPLVHRTNNQKTDSFKKYKKKFEDLYKNQLSSSSFKKSFFDIFKEVNTCPYCNRNFINPIYKEEILGNDNRQQSPDIEHFYPKSMYPFLSLSISNLLPSCAFCNKIKSNFDTYNNFKSPYEIQDEDIKFKFEPIDNQTRIVKVESNFDNVKILNLDDLYEDVHSDYVNEIYSDIIKNPIENRNYLKKFFSLNIDTQEQLYKEKFRNHFKEKDFNKQPLSKLTKSLLFNIKENEK